MFIVYIMWRIYIKFSFSYIFYSCWPYIYIYFFFSFRTRLCPCTHSVLLPEIFSLLDFFIVFVVNFPSNFFFVQIIFVIYLFLIFNFSCCQFHLSFHHIYYYLLYLFFSPPCKCVSFCFLSEIFIFFPWINYHIFLSLEKT